MPRVYDETARGVYIAFCIMHQYLCLPTQCRRWSFLESVSFTGCSVRRMAAIYVAQGIPLRIKENTAIPVDISSFFHMYLLRGKPIRLEQLHKRQLVRKQSNHIQFLYVVIMIMVIIDLVWIYIALFI